MMREITLPLPPSSNGLYFNGPKGRGRIKTPHYRAWQHEAGWMIKTQPGGKITGRVNICIWLPQAMRGDVDNRAKSAIDALVKFGVIDDDRHVASVVCARNIDTPKGQCRITVEAAYLCAR